jgi:thymidylate synthase (FAD)
MARLRLDPHAQWEIREFAAAMYNLVKPLFPEACQAFEDYQQNCMRLSKMEIDLVKRLINKDTWLDLIEDQRSEDGIAKAFGLSKRELNEFKNKLLGS